MLVVLTDRIKRQLQRINREVNAKPYKTDMELYSRDEFWTLIGEEGGDCEDYALEKRRQLLEFSYPPEALRIAICTVNGVGHAVLTVDTNEGTYVLDNNTNKVYPWDAAPRSWDLKWLKRQSATPGKWVAL
jgi:predicted transglutaminase-like cysteine proteinase